MDKLNVLAYDMNRLWEYCNWYAAVLCSVCYCVREQMYRTLGKAGKVLEYFGKGLCKYHTV